MDIDPIQTVARNVRPGDRVIGMDDERVDGTTPYGEFVRIRFESGRHWTTRNETPVRVLRPLGRTRQIIKGDNQ